MSGETANSGDLRFATNERRRFAPAYLRWFAGGRDRHATEPSSTDNACALTP